jgi:hypothetical protein
LCLPWHRHVVTDDVVHLPIANRGFIVKRIKPILIIFKWRRELRRLQLHRRWSAHVWQRCCLPRGWWERALLGHTPVDVVRQRLRGVVPDNELSLRCRVTVACR